MGISRNEALECFRSDDLIGIGMEADAVRRRLHPDGIVSYVMDGDVTFAEEVSEALFETIDSIMVQGASAIIVRGTPNLPLERMERQLSEIRQRYPRLWIHGLSASSILALSSQCHLPLANVILRLHAAGLDSIAGDDAGILDDAIQHESFRTHCTATDWIAVHRAAHQAGVQSTASMTFGAGESFEHRVNHLDAIRQLQDETGGFSAFAPATCVPQGSAAGFEEPTAVEYLKTLAISRMYLDNIPNIQSNLDTQGLKVLQTSLRFGSNDAGSVLQAGGANAVTEEQLRYAIRDAGFRAVERDTLYRTMFLN